MTFQRVKEPKVRLLAENGENCECHPPFPATANFQKAPTSREDSHAAGDLVGTTKVFLCDFPDSLVSNVPCSNFVMVIFKWIF
jgi:hypothetical protein